MVEHKISLRKKMFSSDIAFLAREIREAVNQQLDAYLEESARHFKVRFNGNQYGWTIQVLAADDIGRFLYYGTRPHEIGDYGQILYNPKDSHGNEFAAWGPVDHPGQAPRKAEIDAEVRSAAQKVLMLRRVR